MANVFKCDRCGEYTDKIRPVVRGFEFFNCLGLLLRSYDLCPECWKLTIEFIEKPKEGV